MILLVITLKKENNLIKVNLKYKDITITIKIDNKQIRFLI
jgi:hypothetical protein